MGKFGEMLGVWQLRVGGAELDLVPQIGDNEKLMQVMSEGKKRNDDAWLLKKVGIYLKELVLRDYPHLTETEKKELDMYVEFNIMSLMKEMMVKFRWTTLEKIEAMENAQLKNLMPQV